MSTVATTLPATRVDPSLLDDIRRFGAADVSACFSCGVCTATCPLVTDEGTFPRRMIRYAQLGLRDRLLSSRELWTCYACGQCSEQCP
ncbi:MAG TPA: 4Fe-4S dicluster domain-containing protein, partial [Candidatus Limnocylindrales bacterium]|nr:4Fe-4S dicluster domain-containing protein [Candidatus Limnocylindrales bacterium]